MSGFDPPLALTAIEELAAFVRGGAGQARDRTWLVGIVGVPGCGKSTLAAALCSAVGMPNSICVSLDDFYLEPAQRQARGQRWRGPPGTHDLRLLGAFLHDLQRRTGPIEIPSYDREREQRLPPRVAPAPIGLCVIEGWFVGARTPGQEYEQLANSLDQLIYLEMDAQLAREARLQREARLREAGRGGMSEQAVAQFWDEALAPYLPSLVWPLRAAADVVVALNAAHQVTALHWASSTLTHGH